MKKLLTTSGILAAMLLVACSDIVEETPDQDQLVPATRAIGVSEGKDYYWSGGQKIYLDTDYTKMIVAFDDEQEMKSFSAAPPLQLLRLPV